MGNPATHTTGMLDFQLEHCILHLYLYPKGNLTLDLFPHKTIDLFEWRSYREGMEVEITPQMTAIPGARVSSGSFT